MAKKRKGIFKDLSLLQSKIDEYFDNHLKASGEIADVEGLADFLKTTRDELIVMSYDKRCGEILKLALNKIAKIKKQLAFSGKIQATVLSFDLKNNHGYRDKPDDENFSPQERVIFKGKTSEWAQ